ncbi:MAG: TAXI family TRAP transporter solute-binding subunit [Cyanobacteria bacterium P01_D01_bin.105]
MPPLPPAILSSLRSLFYGVTFLSLASCAAAPTASSLRLATGSPTGYYYQLGQALEGSAEETVNLDLEVLESKGSLDNLEQLLAGEIDFALVQLDVAQAAMKNAEVKAIAVLAQEHVHLISRQSAQPADPSQPTDPNQPTASNLPTNQPSTLVDLAGETIAIGTPGSGIRFTADQILSAARLAPASGQIEVNESGFTEALDLVSAEAVDAAFYVGRLGASATVREAFVNDPSLTLLPISPSLVNFLATQNPGVYRQATIPKGIYGVRPSIPEQELTTLTTPTVLIARPAANEKSVRLMTWAIVATARRYATFYPGLQAGDPNILLRQGLFHVHPSATQVYESGDPRRAWIRYWENNSDLQAGLFLLVATSGIGVLVRRWRKRRSQQLINQTSVRINEISQTLSDRPQEAMRSIEELDQDNRLQFIAGKVSDEVYAQMQQRTQSLNDQCSSILDAQRREQILETLLLLDEWQETLQTDPDLALQKLGQIRQQYRDLLLSNQVDIQAYMELVELTLISVMTLAPKQREQVNIASALSGVE